MWNYFKKVLLVLPMLLLLSACSSKSCVLCNQDGSTRPCLVNLSTGEISELPDIGPQALTPDGSVADTLSFCTLAGFEGVYLAKDGCWQFTLSTDMQTISSDYFCSACCKTLKSAASTGLALAEFHSGQAPALHPMTEGNSYTLEGYILTFSRQNGTLVCTIALTTK